MQSTPQETSFVGMSHLGSSPDEVISLDAESRLQSLGFTFIDGKPRFNVDKDRPVAEDNMQQSSMAESEDSLSFVVLKKASMDSIQASSLDCFSDIQQKAMSIDYSSMISSLNTSEIHQKLTELLQENGKLKETLKRNNVAMKQQFNTLATWRELVMKVHQNHKEKFVETEKLINYLKQQNAELKLKLNNNCFDDLTEKRKMVNTSDVSGEHENTEASTSTSEPQTTEKQASFTNDSNASTVIYEKLPLNMKELLNITDSMNLDTAKIINTKAISMDTLSSHSNKSSNCRSLGMTSSLKELMSNNKSCDKCNTKDENIKSLNEFISLLEYKLKHAVALIQFCIKNSTNSGRHLQSIQRFNKELTEIFASEIEEFPILREYLNEFIIQTVKGATLREPDSLTSESEICNLHNKSFSKKTESVKQSILLDKEKEGTVQTKGCENPRNELPEYQCDAETTLKKISDLRKLLEQEKASLEEEKRLISSQRQSLEAECRSVDNAKQLLEQERISFNAEKASLDHQIELYESHGKDLLKQKKGIESKCVEYVAEIKSLREYLEQKESAIRCLKKYAECCKEEKNLLEIQLQIYKRDFEQEKAIKELFVKQHNKLVVDLENQFKFSKKLHDRLTDSKSYSFFNWKDMMLRDNFKPPEVLNLACPMCDSTFEDASSLQSHVHTCFTKLV